MGNVLGAEFGMVDEWFENERVKGNVTSKSQSGQVPSSMRADIATIRLCLLSFITVRVLII